MTNEPFLFDLRDEMRDRLESYKGGWATMQGYTTISIATLERWLEGMTRASLIIEGPDE